MPTKSKKRGPKKDGHVSYQQVSLAQPNVVLREVDYIVERAARCDPRFVTLGQLLFLSTDTGDAWMLDPEDHLALCLAKAGSRVAVQIVETVTRYAIEWTASYRFEGDAFVVTDESGQRVILGYPVRELVQADQRTARWIAAILSCAVLPRARPGPAPRGRPPSSRNP